jgi:excisionase family DNA binding protein
MSYDGAAAFCGISKRSIERCVELGELEVLYYGRKPLIPKRQLVMWLAKKLEAARAERAEWERTWGWPRRPG